MTGNTPASSAGMPAWKRGVVGTGLALAAFPVISAINLLLATGEGRLPDVGAAELVLGWATISLLAGPLVGLSVLRNWDRDNPWR